MHEIGPFSIPAMRNFVPAPLRPWIYIAIVIVFQFSGGVYLAAVNEMVGGTALLQEDIMMAGYASLIGLALTFAIVFRLKFRFCTKTVFTVCALGIIAGNLICMYTRNVPILVSVCFITGFLRMWATFECNSTIQLWITPKRDLSVFFCYIYLLVQGSIQLSGMTTVYTAVFAQWEYMHWLIIAALVVVLIATQVLFRTYRSMRKLPLYGIDWLGGVMWGVVALCVAFVCTYGEHYDWWDSDEIWFATLCGICVGVLNYWRSTFIRHPYITPEVWRQKPLYTTIGIFLIVDILIAPGHLLDHIYTESILGYDAEHFISLNRAGFAGIVCGSIFMWLTFARRKWPYRRVTVIAFGCIAAYLALSYFTIDYDQSKSSLILPVFLRNFGYVMIAIAFLTALTRIPFPIFFQSVTAQSFISASLGGAWGSAILGRLLKVIMQKNAMLLGGNIDAVNTHSAHLPFAEIYGAVQQQALMVSMKEIYGWLLWICLFCIGGFLLYTNSYKPIHAIHPTFRSIRRAIKHTLRMDKKRDMQEEYS